jgi:hypothetical protein
MFFSFFIFPRNTKFGADTSVPRNTLRNPALERSRTVINGTLDAQKGIVFESTQTNLLLSLKSSIAWI